MTLRDQLSVLADLASLGYTDFWSTEVNRADAFGLLCALAAVSRETRLGTAIASVFSRSPSLRAMQAASLASLAPGRSVLGLGASSPAIVSQWNGLAYGQPYERLRDTVDFLDRVFSGEKVDRDYETFSVHGFRLTDPPPTPPQIMLAGLRPKLLRLGAQRRDGVITNWVSAADIERFRDVVGDDTEVVTRIFVVPTDDDKVALDLAVRAITAYLTVPAYAAAQRWLGRTEALAPMWERWRLGERGAARGVVPPDVAAELVLWGTPEQLRDKIAEYVDNGVTTPVIALLAESVIPTGADEYRGLLAALRRPS